jgi:hypothetical protein
VYYGAVFEIKKEIPVYTRFAQINEASGHATIGTTWKEIVHELFCLW